MIFKCKMCGGDLMVSLSQRIATCEYCYLEQTIPDTKSEETAELFNKANLLRLQKSFDESLQLYNLIIDEYPESIEAHWDALLCEYGIEYVVDPYTGANKPTIHRMQIENIYSNPYYQHVISNADQEVGELYKKQATEIYEIERKFQQISQRDNPYDIFICYKENNQEGNRSEDSFMAEEVYNALTASGYNVFLSRISLDKIIGEEYEPHIFNAINTAKVMIVMGTSAENLDSTWVKNEWKRYLYLMKRSSGRTMIVAYKHITPDQFPEELTFVPTRVDYGQLGALQEITRRMVKLIAPKITQGFSKDSNLINGLLLEANTCIEKEDFESALQILDKALDLDAGCSRAYLLKTIISYGVLSEDDLPFASKNFTTNYDWMLALENASDIEVAKLKKIIGTYDKVHNNPSLILKHIRGLLESQKFARASAVIKLQKQSSDNNKVYGKEERAELFLFSLLCRYGLPDLKALADTSIDLELDEDWEAAYYDISSEIGEELEDVLEKTNNNRSKIQEEATMELVLALLFQQDKANESREAFEQFMDAMDKQLDQSTLIPQKDPFHLPGHIRNFQRLYSYAEGTDLQLSDKMIALIRNYLENIESSFNSIFVEKVSEVLDDQERIAVEKEEKVVKNKKKRIILVILVLIIMLVLFFIAKMLMSSSHKSFSSSVERKTTVQLMNCNAYYGG